MTNETWGQVRGELLKAVGENNFTAWIDPIVFDRLDERTARFHVPTNFFGSWVSQNFGDVILRHLVSAGVMVDRVEFAVGQKPAVEAGNANAAPRQVTNGATPPGRATLASPVRTGSADLPGATLNPAYTFEDFIVGKATTNWPIARGTKR